MIVPDIFETTRRCEEVLTYFGDPRTQENAERRTQSRMENSPPFHDGPRASRTSSRVLRNSRCASASFAASLP